MVGTTLRGKDSGRVRRSRSRGGRRISLAVAAVLLIVPGAAHATRYASPGVAGPEPCTEAMPCSIQQAVESAPSGETVIVLSTGAPYNVGADTVSVPSGVTVRGEPGEPRPTITSVGTGPLGTLDANSGAIIEELRLTASGGAALSMINAGAVARGVYLEADYTPIGFVVHLEGTTLERAQVVAPTPSATQIGVFMGQGALLRDSFVHFDGVDSGTAVTTGSGASTIRNATLVAESTGSHGLFTSSSWAGTGASAAVSVANSIISGAGTDIWADDEHLATTEDVGIVVTRSSFDTVFEPDPLEFDVTLVAPNQDAAATPPLLMHPGVAGDFHQLAGSPTRDAGAVDAFTGAFDIDGEPRCLGSAPDIGADEFTAAACPPPPVSTPATPATTPLTAAPPKKCRKGRKLKKGKCVKKRKKRA